MSKVESQLSFSIYKVGRRCNESEMSKDGD